MQRILATAAVLAAAIILLLSVIGPQTVIAQTTAHTVMFGLVGDLAYDPSGGSGGATRDITVPNSLVINPGDTINFVNRSGGQHQPAVFGPNLRNNGSPIATNFADLTVSHAGAPAWGNFVVPPDGAIPSADDPATDIDERRVRDGLIGLGPTPLGVSAADRQAGRIDYSQTFSTPGSYMIICNFRPHVLDFGQATFVLVRGLPPTTAAPTSGAAPAAQTTSGTTQTVPSAPKTGQAGLLNDGSGAVTLLLGALALAVVFGARALAPRTSTR